MDKKIATLLGLSVLVNAFLFGFLLSRGMERDHGSLRLGNMDRQRPPGPPMIFEDILSKLSSISPEGQSKASAILEKYKAQNITRGPEDGRTLFEEAHKILTADTLDIKRLHDIHKEIASRDLKFRSAIGDMITEIATILSDEDRIKLFSDMAPMPPGKKRPAPPHRSMGKDDEFDRDTPPPPEEFEQ